MLLLWRVTILAAASIFFSCSSAGSFPGIGIFIKGSPVLLQQCNALEIRAPFDYNSDIVDCNVGIPGYVSYDPADPTVQAAASVAFDAYKNYNLTNCTAVNTMESHFTVLEACIFGNQSWPLGSFIALKLNGSTRCSYNNIVVDNNVTLASTLWYPLGGPALQLGVLRIAFANLDSLDESSYPEFSCNYRGGTTGSYDPADAVYRNRTTTTDYRFYENIDLQIVESNWTKLHLSLCTSPGHEISSSNFSVASHCVQRGMGGKGKYVIQGYVKCHDKSTRAGSDKKEDETHAVIITETVNLGAYIFYGYNRQITEFRLLNLTQDVQLDV